jgi:hypothetical protein
MVYFFHLKAIVIVVAVLSLVVAISDRAREDKLSVNKGCYEYQRMELATS